MHRYRGYLRHLLHARALASSLVCLTLVSHGLPTASISAQSPSKPTGRPTPQTRPAAQRPTATPAAQRTNGNKAAPTPAPAPTAAPAPTTAPPAPSVLEKEPAKSVSDKPLAATKSSASNGQYRLQHKLRSGDIVRMRTVHVANTVTRIQGTEDVSESRTTSDKVWQVSSVSPDGLMTFEYRIDAVDMSQKQGDKPEITYNSRTDKTVPEIFSRVADTIAKPIAQVTIDATGTVIERDNQSKTPPLGMGELAIPLPADSVDIGAQWSIPRECRVKLENGIQKSMKLREQYTLEKVSAGVATIRVETTTLTPYDDPGIEAQLMQQMSRGVIKFDMDRGRLISKQLDWDDEVVGFRGAETSLKYYARFTEELAESTPQSAARPSVIK